MSPWIGQGAKQQDVEKRLALIETRLLAGEEVLAIFPCASVRTGADYCAVTNMRILGVTKSRDPVRMDLSRADVTGVTFAEGKLGGPILRLARRNGTQERVGRVDSANVDAIADLIEPEFEAVTASSEAAQLIPLVTGRAGKAQLKEILSQCRGAELPLFIIADGLNGALAAFEDRCVIVKKGAMTSLMAGSFGQGRVTVFPYHQVTAVEYNGGMLHGVLEILTASYQGSSNKDYWRGSARGRNANSDDPFTLSNTLPLNRDTYRRARPRIEHLQSLVSESRRPSPSRAPQQTGTSLADELAKLGSLHESGLLTEAEFARAKTRLLESAGD